MQFVNGDQVIEAGVRDFLYVPAGTRHAFKNPFDVP